MAVNEAALKSMAKMIQVMLPYEGDYESKEPATQCISEIFELIHGYNPKLNEFEGFMNYVMKNIDARGDMEKLDRLLMRIWAIIHKHYPPVEDKEKTGQEKRDWIVATHIDTHTSV